MLIIGIDGNMVPTVRGKYLPQQAGRYKEK
jgi:hypothetical protein